VFTRNQYDEKRFYYHYFVFDRHLIMENTKIMNRTAIRKSISLSLDDLVLAAQKGDLESFNQLVLFFQDGIFDFVNQILGDKFLAEDITQNIFLKAYQNLHRLRNGSFLTWLYRIAANASFDELSGRKKNPVLSFKYEETGEKRSPSQGNLPDANLLLEQVCADHGLDRAILEAFNCLNPDHRAVVALVDLQDFDYQEVAQVLGIKAGTVKSRLARGRQQLRSQLGKNEC
jgi:RNA polymerase sigma-70 factor (ECF subfamily)